MSNHYAKIEYIGMKTVGVTDYTNQTPPTPFGWKKCLSSTPVKMRNYKYGLAWGRIGIEIFRKLKVPNKGQFVSMDR